MIKIVGIILLTLLLQSEGSYVLKHGTALNPKLQVIAQEIGIKNPQNIRILIKGKILGLSEVAGLTIGQAILVKRGYLTEELIVHELIHVKQYQDYENIYYFLKKYLNELFKYGYYNAPLEIDARLKSKFIIENNQ